MKKHCVSKEKQKEKPVSTKSPLEALKESAIGSGADMVIAEDKVLIMFTINCKGKVISDAWIKADGELDADYCGYLSRRIRRNCDREQVNGDNN